MIKFPANDEIEVYVNKSGSITFKQTSSYSSDFDLVVLTVEQFSRVMDCAEELIREAELVKVSEDEVDYE